MLKQKQECCWRNNTIKLLNSSTATLERNLKRNLVISTKQKRS